MVTEAWGFIHGGGINVMIQTLANQLKKTALVDVLVPSWQVKKATTESTGGFNVVRLGLASPVNVQNRFRSILSFFALFPSVLLQLTLYITRRDIDVVHLHYLGHYHFYFRLLRIVGGPPYIITLHGSDVARFSEQPWLSRKLCEFALRGASAVVAVSDNLRTLAQAQWPDLDAITVVHNGVSFEHATLPTDADYSEVANILALQGAYICALGAVEPVKNQIVLIKAWPQVLEAYPDFHLIIAGTGTLEPSFDALIQSLNCQHRIHLVGKLVHLPTLKVLQEGRGLALTSKREGLPYALLEAGMLGKAAIASRVGGMPEVIDDGVTGILVPVDDVDATAKAVMTLVGDEANANRMGLAARERVKKQFSAESMGNGYLELYRAAIGAQ